MSTLSSLSVRGWQKPFPKIRVLTPVYYQRSVAVTNTVDGPNNLNSIITGGTASYRFTAVSTGLPVTISNLCVVSGTPTTAVTQAIPYEFLISDSLGQYVYANIYIGIIPGTTWSTVEPDGATVARHTVVPYFKDRITNVTARWTYSTYGGSHTLTDGITIPAGQTGVVQTSWLQSNYMPSCVITADQPFTVQ